MSSTPRASTGLMEAAEKLARDHHAKYDPSHDFLHVERVRGKALAIARSLEDVGPNAVDLTVVECAALFHDMLDRKYLANPDVAPPTAIEHLTSFFLPFVNSNDITSDQVRLICRVVDNVSYSKEVKRIREGRQTNWHDTCLELHCVQDADKLDSLGAIGIMRCSAYSAVSSRPLVESSVHPSSSGSAVDHFHEKLFNLEEMMRTNVGKREAKKRTAFMRTFLQELGEETVH